MELLFPKWLIFFELLKTCSLYQFHKGFAFHYVNYNNSYEETRPITPTKSQFYIDISLCIINYIFNIELI